MSDCRLLEQETERLADWLRGVLSSGTDLFLGMREVVVRLGAHPNGRKVAFGFWIPGSAGNGCRPELEIFTPLGEIDFPVRGQTVSFSRSVVPMRGVGDFWWAVVEGPRIGKVDRSGSFYWVRSDGRQGVFRDCLAYSLPFGSFGPAEIYDVKSTQAERRDRDYFRRLADPAVVEGNDGPPRITPPANILEIHPGSATRTGTLSAFARQMDSIAAKLSTGADLTPSEKALANYDAFELLPLEPVAEPLHPPCWSPLGPETETTIEVELRRPGIFNWGYDTLIAGFPAVSPTLLASGRPDELVELASTLHNLPGGPVKLIFDVVFGHAHRQAECLLDPVCFDGFNRYGLNLNYRHPVVRAILLEMLRRKLNWGADGLRVDASQDVLINNPETGDRIQDDDFLELMANTVAEAAGVRFRPFMIFEDGRPWPRVDWKLTATFSEVTRRLPEALQWSPLTFSSNEPLDPTFWISRQWRLEEVARRGSHWVTGVANHDTLRHATRLDPALAADWESPKEAFAECFNNPSTSLLFTGFLPGVPMDFLNASREAPWTFVRNCDDYRLKTVCGEVGALDWTLDAASYEKAKHFQRLKALGFSNLSSLRGFARVLVGASRLVDFDPPAILQHLRLLRERQPFPETPIDLDRFCEAWMDDWGDYCRAAAVDCHPDPEKADFHHRLRRFRLSNPWLRGNLSGEDRFERLLEYGSSVVYRGVRTAPDRSLRITLLVNMAGQPVPLSERVHDLRREGWTLELETPRSVRKQKPLSVGYDPGTGFLLCRQLSDQPRDS